MDTSADSPMQGLQKAAVCSICLEYFKDPVSIDCGHNFCLGCITQCCEKFRSRFCCPHCRRRACKRDFRPNRELASMVDIAKRLKLQAEKVAGGKGACGRHQEPLKLFCEDDQSLICVVCDRSKEHRAHTVLPIEEAALNYKEQIQNQSQSLKQERAKLQELKQDGERTTEEGLRKLDAERTKVVSEFEQLHQFLEEMEQALLDQLNGLEQEIKEGQKENSARFSEGISDLGDLINEMDEKCKKPDSEFLQNVKEILTRSKRRSFHLPAKASPDLKEELRKFAKKTISLAETLKKFRDSLHIELQEKEEEVPSTVADVTLDLDTAGPYVILSDNGKSVRLGGVRQKRTKSRDQFNVYPCVLGCNGFTSGRHSWEVEVVERGCWAMGVARDSVKRKKRLSFRPEEGIWALEHLGADHYRALTSPPTPLPLSKGYERIRVCLDYEGGMVAFFDAVNGNWIFTFPTSLFAGERIHPWFWVGLRSHLRLFP
ncbi:zinc finger protein RFP-like [Elgaria multicarinata webbii]|uniref:zinc finger protein RFP-like n=1 Tax=Elgaria multicarinata webbii TaxID=159646 RepID=UPI002FCD237C